MPKLSQNSLEPSTLGLPPNSLLPSSTARFTTSRSAALPVVDTQTTNNFSSFPGMTRLALPNTWTPESVVSTMRSWFAESVPTGYIARVVRQSGLLRRRSEEARSGCAESVG
jgi:hypothetical protein